MMKIRNPRGYLTLFFSICATFLMAAIDAQESWALPSSIAQSSLANEMETALGIAHEAGKSILSLRQEVIEECVRVGQIPEFTKADMASNSLICQRLHQAFPMDGYISQEGIPSDIPSNSFAERTWLVDPLDGTSGFCKKEGKGFCIIITLVDQSKQPVLNVSHFPDYPKPGQDTTYFAIKDCGAFKQVGDNATERLSISSYSGKIVPFVSTETSVIADIYNNLREQGALDILKEKFIKGASCGLRICSLAEEAAPANLYLTACLPTTCGSKEDLARVSFTRTWDVGGVVVLQEAGGSFGMLDPRDSIDWCDPQGMIYPHDGHQNVFIAAKYPEILDAVKRSH